MRGRFHNGIDKWFHINQLVRDDKIAVLALQETHLNQDQTDRINSMFQDTLHIVASADPENHNSKGVALVINKRLLGAHDIDHYELLPGRALLVSIPWNSQNRINVLNIYAPNDPTRNATLWETIHDGIINLPQPDIILGDFNFVEDPLDRLPAHFDNPTTVDNWQSLKSHLSLTDGWRATFPSSLSYTFAQSAGQGGHQSRIDRIYIQESMLQFSKDWEIGPSPVHTDHYMVSVRISKQNMPFIGKGRWTLNPSLLRDKEIIGSIAIEAAKLRSSLDHYEAHRTDQDNPQTAFKSFKDNAVAILRNRAKKIIPMAKQRIERLKENLRQVLNDTSIPDDDRLLVSCELRERINTLRQSIHDSTRDRSHLKIRIESESPTSGLWAKSGKERKARDVITELQALDSPPDNPQYINRSSDMAELARSYYENLQQKDLSPPDVRVAAIDNVLSKVHTSLPEDEVEKLDQKITLEEVSLTLKDLPNGKATGLDGLPYEFWKWLGPTPINRADGDPSNFNECLHEVFLDIQHHGVAPDTNFTEGWICPLYKKKDRRDIANYRPITLLNSDYKLLTKILTLRLASSAPHIIHENQAGFIPGRVITDQIRLTQMILHYAEATEENGVIVALDQEKAYDKIAHDYLWLTLEKYGLPPSFINTIKSLYESAETLVIINGESSSTFKVTRGVRQGDPLSCLLFDIAIEPLAELIRQSNLEGFKAHGQLERTIVSLFADDTTVYLSEKDNIGDLYAILQVWCIASGAKFNLEKTEVIPIGTKDYRAQVIQTAHTNQSSDPFNESIRIARDGQAIRILGAWLGNGIDELAVWSPIIEKIDARLKRWDLKKPSIEGRKIIAQWTIGAMTQYLTYAQGMPTCIEKALTKRLTKFAWDGSGKPNASLDLLCAPTSKGGKGLLHLKYRNEAIELVWLKKLLSPPHNRPTWASFANAILAHFASKTPVAPYETRVNFFLQSWNVNPTKLPSHLRRILKTAKTYNLTLDATAFHPNHLSSAPIWFHIGATHALNRLNNHHDAKCLRRHHNITSVGDVASLAGLVLNEEHRHSNYCRCPTCMHVRTTYDCMQPTKCIAFANELLNCLPTKWLPSENIPDEVRVNSANPAPQGESRVFRVNLMEVSHLENAFRIIRPDTTSHPLPARRAAPPNPPHPTAVTEVLCCATSMINDDGNYIAGGCVWFGANDTRNISFQPTPSDHTSKTTGALGAMLLLLQRTASDVHLRIHINDKNIIQNLTKRLDDNEDLNWFHLGDSDLYRALVAKLKSRSADTTFEKWQEDKPTANQKEALELAKSALENPHQRDVAPEIDPSFSLRGQRLSAGTQRSFYQHLVTLHVQKHYSPKASLTNNIIATQRSVKDLWGATPTPPQLWKSTRSRDIPKNIRNFLWKCLHNKYKIGSYWRNIPNFEERGSCRLCEGIETMQHILVDCQESRIRRVVWGLASELWRRREPSWPEISFGSILGANLPNCISTKSTKKKGRNRLFAILVLESAHLIWKLRCEWLIENQGDQEKFPSDNEIHNKWVKAINMHLKFDKLQTDTKRYGSRAIKADLVLKTWSGVLLNEENLPDNWIWESGVLVGITPRRPPGRGR